MKECEIVTEKRACEGKDKTAIHLDVDGQHYRNIWTLQDGEITPDILKALRNAVDVGISLAKSEVTNAVSGLYIKST